MRTCVLRITEGSEKLSRLGNVCSIHKDLSSVHSAHRKGWGCEHVFVIPVLEKAERQADS